MSKQPIPVRGIKQAHDLISRWPEIEFVIQVVVDATA
jgi:hypothetical protein